jgi:hypothetical protein
MEIRHSGRALIRGKIRRVWRPRYLELCDNGLVRYYELLEDASSTSGNNNVVQPKCTLVIYHARIIDVTTLRDMHVGLPMGSYGFVFHGANYQMGMQSTSSTDNCHPSELKATTRDFLCAVDTLEEAQSWVVALQWAAMEKRREDEWWHEDEDFYATACRTTDAFQVVSTSSTTKQKTRTSTKKQKKTVVTKVRSLQLVRVEGWHWELAYVIHVLLLHTQSSQGQLIVEERTIVRTLNDIRTMLMELKEEVTNPKSLQVLQQVSLPLTSMSTYSDHVASLPRVECYAPWPWIYISAIHSQCGPFCGYQQCEL